MSIVHAYDLEGSTVTAIDTGLNPRAFGQSKISQGSSESGFIVHPDGTVETWFLQGNFCKLDSNGKERIFLYGEFFNGTSLLDIILEEDANNAWRVLHALVLSLEKVGSIYKKEILTAISTAGPDSVIYAEDGTFLVLPRDIYIRCVSDNGEKIEVHTRLNWLHPDYRLIGYQKAFVFLIGTLAYKILSREEPFIIQKTDGTISEQIARLIRKKIYVPIDLNCYGISTQGAKTISKMLDINADTQISSFLQLGTELPNIIEKFENSTAPSALFLEKQNSEKTKIRNKAKRESFIRRNKGTFIFVSIMAAFVGLLGQQYMQDQGKKPTSVGLTSVEVVTGFYDGIANLDQEIPPAYMAKDVETSYIEYAMHLYITSRVQLAYDQNVAIISPQELMLKNGNREKNSVYGITNISISPIFERDETALYEVSFFYWLPVSPIPEGIDLSRSEKMPVQLSVYAYKDVVSIEWFKDRWLITEIFEEQRTVLEEIGENVLQAVLSKNYEKSPWLPR